MYEYVSINPQSLISLDAEKAHELTIHLLGAVGRSPAKCLLEKYLQVAGMPKQCMGITLKIRSD